MTFEQVLLLLRQNEQGRGVFLATPFGRRLVCYADSTATGQHLDFVENWVAGIRPYYANTHTTTSSTGRLMTELREEARKVIERAVNASHDDVVLFVGAGATAAANKLVGLLGFRISEPLEREHGLARHVPPEQRPVVFVGPYEHHSNQLPWLESVADVEEVNLTFDGGVDLADLSRRLEIHVDRPIKIGAFSAASNVDGLLTDVRSVARTLHQGGAYACFDYATAAPYVPIDMHPEGLDEHLDAIFLSTHKFPGGPQGSGVLVANRALFRSRVPERPGGGTVDYVASFDGLSADYTQRLDEREEGGTPSIVGDLRAGAAFLVKEMSGPERIFEREVEMAAHARARLARHPRVRLLGPAEQTRLAIFSFNVEGLHHGLASTLLDHLFGIQNRSGCSCAGPYGHRLLDIDRGRSERYRKQIAHGRLGLKPGWVRIALPYYTSEEALEFVLGAVEFVADHGREFVPDYRLGWWDGVWRPLGGSPVDPRPPGLALDSLLASVKELPAVHRDAPLSEAQIGAERKRYFGDAHRAAKALRDRWQRVPPIWNPPTGLPEVDSLLWFEYVHADDVRGGCASSSGAKDGDVRTEPRLAYGKRT
jgi:selenocysteine lyase/cysteine desulfurase